jgi:hypothetical protein
MTIERNEKLVKAWLLIKSSVIDDENWGDVTTLIRDLTKENKASHVVRADWIEGPYDLIVPVVTDSEADLEILISKIRELYINPPIVDDLEVAKVKKHNPPSDSFDPTRDNAWG